MHAVMAFKVQRMETTAKKDRIMARFRPIAPKPPPPATAGTSKRSRPEDDYHILPPCQLAAPVWWPAGIGSNKSRPVPSSRIPPLPSVPASDEHLVRLSLAQPGTEGRTIPVEHDMLSRLQARCQVIVRPRPTRPLRTTICIDSAGNIIAGPESMVAMSKKTAMEVEAEVEKDMHPTIVSGVQDRVFLVNDAYKAMVGQPLCLWLDSLPGTSALRRINGEVVLKIQDFSLSSSSRLPNVAGGATNFPCTARISWELDDGTIASLTVPCAVERLSGVNSSDYRSIWRFDSTKASIIYCLS